MSLRLPISVRRWSVGLAAALTTLALGTAPVRAAAPSHPSGDHPTRPQIAFSIHPSGSVTKLIGEFRELKAMGATAVRIDFAWTHIEPQGFDPTGASYDWTQNDADVAAAEAVGLQVDAIVLYSNPLYSTAGAANGGDDTYPPDDPATFARFAADVARHYQGRIARFEVWNEENLSFRFWKPQADPAAYGRLLCATYDQLKQVSPTVPVSTGGVFKGPVGDFTGYLIDGADFIDQMLTASNDRRCFDAVSYHPYPYPFTAPETVVPGPDSTSVTGYAARLRSVLDAHGVPADVPLWNTEIGWPTNPTANGVTEEMQAEYTVRSSLLSWQGGVPLMTWYDQFDDDDADQTTDQESHFGFFHADGSAKPVVGAMQTYDRVLGGAGWTFTADLSRRLGLPVGEDGIGQAYALEFSNGSDHVLALWYANENIPSGCATGIAVIYCPVMPELPAPATIPVDLPLRQSPHAVRLTTMLGETGPASATLQVGQAPVYLSWHGAAL